MTNFGTDRAAQAAAQAAQTAAMQSHYQPPPPMQTSSPPPGPQQPIQPNLTGDQAIEILKKLGFANLLSQSNLLRLGWGTFLSTEPRLVLLLRTGFGTYYDTIHRYETNRLRNIARFFGHLLANDAVSWNVVGCISLTEEDTTSISRIFVKAMLTEMQE